MPRTVLVVDDSLTMRQMVTVTLKEAGYAVLEGQNGQEGLARLAQQPVELIITDLNMPVLDGIGFIKQVRTQPKHKFTPILMLTTESNATKKAEGKAAGATGWLVKPFNPEQLLGVIGRVLPPG